MTEGLARQLWSTGDADNRMAGARGIAQGFVKQPRVGGRIACHKNETAAAAAQGGDDTAGEGVVML
ncbi:MAG TPA: hypothetical protein VGM07_01200 [Stellaceae bacterium]|jgi:hypothetical protein